MYFGKPRVAAGGCAVLITGLAAVLIAGMTLQSVCQSAVTEQSPTPTKRRIPPPMFSPAYVKALDGVLDLEASDVNALESRLAQNPDEFAARLKLMAYCMRADRASLKES